MPHKAPSVKSARWFTVTGPHAFCEGCEWGMNGDNDDRRLTSAARFHAKDSGHRIRIERGQIRYLNA